MTGVQPTHRFGLLDIDPATEKLRGFYQHKVTEEKDGKSHDFINGGFMVFKNEIFSSIAEGSMIESVFEPLMAKGELSVYRHHGKWKCMDTYKEVEEMNDAWQHDPFWKVW